jgi:hypothetical protein
MKLKIDLDFSGPRLELAMTQTNIDILFERKGFFQSALQKGEICLIRESPLGVFSPFDQRVASVHVTQKNSNFLSKISKCWRLLRHHYKFKLDKRLPQKGPLLLVVDTLTTLYVM